MIPKLKIRIENGVIIFGEREQNYILSLKNDEYYLTIKKEYSDRSNNQNRYLWGCVYPIISNEVGYTNDEVHEICKNMFLKKWVILETKDGFKEVEITKSTKDLTTVEFENYLSQIRQWVSIELGIFIALPNEAEY